MDVYETIESRRTIRDFEDRPVPAEIIEKMLDAGLKAPTNDHMRQWEFVVVDDKKQREKLLHIQSMEDAEAIDGWLAASAEVSQYASFMQAYTDAEYSGMLQDAGLTVRRMLDADTWPSGDAHQGKLQIFVAEKGQP